MATIGTLSRYQTAMDNAMMEMEMASKSKSSTKSSSKSGSDSPKFLSDLAELEKLEKKVRLSYTDTASASSTSASNSSSNSAKKKDREVELQKRVLRVIERRVNQTSMNIMLVIKYITSPLRLYLKFLVQFAAPEEREHMAASIKAPKRTLEDLRSPWNANDTLGLKMLIKMRRMKTQTFSNLKSNTDFMKQMKPGAEGNRDTRVAYYLFNELMHPGKELENDAHMWFDNFMSDDQDLLESVGFEANDARKDLVNELAFSLNMFATSVTALPLKFKHLHNGAVQQETVDCEKALHAIYSKLMSVQEPQLHQGMTFEMLDAPTKHAYMAAVEQFKSARTLATSMDLWAAVDEAKASRTRPVM